MEQNRTSQQFGWCKIGETTNTETPCKATQSPRYYLSLLIHPTSWLRFDGIFQVFSRHHLHGRLRGIPIVAPVTTALRPVRPPTNTRIMDCTNAACVVHPSRFPIQDISGMAQAIQRNFERKNKQYKVGDGGQSSYFNWVWGTTVC